MTPTKRVKTQSTARRAALLMLAACLALSLIGVAAAQSAQHFDLACRGALLATGGVRTFSGGEMALIGAAGQPGAGLSSSARYGVRGGYVQAYSLEGQVTQALVPEQALVSDDGHFMPFIARAAARIVRPCVW